MSTFGGKMRIRTDLSGALLVAKLDTGKKWTVRTTSTGIPLILKSTIYDPLAHTVTATYTEISEFTQKNCGQKSAKKRSVSCAKGQSKSKSGRRKN